MAKIEIDLEEIYTEQLDKRDRKIATLQRQLAECGEKRQALENTLRSLTRAKQALLDAADLLDPYRYEDDF